MIDKGMVWKHLTTGTLNESRSPAPDELPLKVKEPVDVISENVCDLCEFLENKTVDHKLYMNQQCNVARTTKRTVLYQAASIVLIQGNTTTILLFFAQTLPEVLFRAPV